MVRAKAAPEGGKFNQDYFVLCWKRLAASPQVGPALLNEVAERLVNSEFSIHDLIIDPSSVMQSLGFNPSVATMTAANLAAPEIAVETPDSIRALTPESEDYPVSRLAGKLPLPIPMYVVGNVSLLKAAGIAVAGSRKPHESALRYAFEVSQAFSRIGRNIVSGHAAGVDEAAHLGALRAGGTTTAVLAEGLANFRPRTSLRDAEPESVLFVSGWDLDARWTSFRAMERNPHIAALSEGVVIVSANESGGSWEQARLCLRVGKPLFVVDFRPEIASGNRRLIELGAIELAADSPSDAPEIINRHLKADVQTQLEFF